MACCKAENALLECVSAYKEVMHFMISQTLFCTLFIMSCLGKLLQSFFFSFKFYLCYRVVRLPISLSSGVVHFC